MYYDWAKVTRVNGLHGHRFSITAPGFILMIFEIVQLGLDFKLNTKIGLDTTHHPPTHHHKLLGHFQAY